MTSHRCRIRESRGVASDANVGKGLDGICNRIKVDAFCISALHATHSSLHPTAAGRRTTDGGRVYERMPPASRHCKQSQNDQ